MTASRRLLAGLLGAVAACRGRAAPPRRPPAPPAPAPAVSTPPPRPAAPVAVGWEFVPIDDGLGGTDVGWLLLTTRESPPRSLANLGRRARCRELVPFAIPTDDATPPPTATPFASVYCAGPDRAAALHAVLPSREELDVVLTDCPPHGPRCADPRGYTHFRDRDSVPVGFAVAPVPAPLVTRPRAPAAPGDGATRVALRWAFEPSVQALNYNGTEPAVALEISGAASRRYDFGPLGVCGDPLPAQMTGGHFPPGVLLGLHCYSASWSNHNLAVTRVGDELRLYESAYEEMGAVIDRLHIVARVPIAPGTIVAAEPVAP